jgi:tRNA dimethylallyltransferase
MWDDVDPRALEAGLPQPLAVPPDVACWYLTGPTAAGKTQVGIELAERLGAEIISLDSMAVYRGMDIGTAKPPAEVRARIPHHLIDIRDPTDDFSLSDYIQAAHGAIADIRARGREVLFVGGTPLYLKAMIRGIYPGPPADWAFRREVETEVATAGVEQLHQRLAQVDPLTAARLHPHDQRRIIRALEVHRVTGQPISHQQLQFDEGTPAESCRVFVVSWPRPTLHKRIDKRVERMFAVGLVDEVQRLLARFGRLGRTASQAVGYRETLEHIEHGRPLAETIERVKARTRQFARRQETWFRSLCECRRVERSESDSAAAIAARILEEGAAFGTGLPAPPRS